MKISPDNASSDEMYDHSAPCAGVPRKRSYCAPTLDRLGDVRDLTLGASPGIGDSGQAGYEDPAWGSGSLMDRPADDKSPGSGDQP